MNTAIATLLQLTASLLMGVQHDPRISAAASQQAIQTGSQVVQLADQALANIPFPVPQNDSIWPNVKDLQNAPYLDASGHWVPFGQGVQPISSSISFGDMNGDGTDDAALVVQQTASSGVSGYVLAVMLNQGGILFNIADAPLGSVAPTIYSHAISNGTLVMDMEANGAPRSVVHYVLLGNQIDKM
jgi:hypothetical protein